MDSGVIFFLCLAYVFIAAIVSVCVNDSRDTIRRQNAKKTTTVQQKEKTDLEIAAIGILWPIYLLRFIAQILIIAYNDLTHPWEE